MNSLAKIFNNVEVEFFGEICFIDTSSKKKYVKRIKQSIENNLPFDSEVDESFSRMIDKSLYYPLFKEKDFNVKIEYADKELDLGDERKVILKTQKKNPDFLQTKIGNVSFTLNFEEEEKGIGCTYDIDFRKPIQITAALEAVETTLLFLKRVFGISKKNLGYQPEAVREILNFFLSFYVVFYALKEIENVIGSPIVIDNTFDVQSDLEKVMVLYTFLVKQKPLYLPNVTVKNIPFENGKPYFANDPLKNEFTELLYPGRSEKVHLFDQTVTIYHLNFIDNVRVQEIEQIGDHKTYIVSESSLNPMHFMTQGFPESIDDKVKAESYENFKDAKEWSYYYDRLYEELKNNILSE